MVSYRFPWAYELAFKFPPGLIFRKKSLNFLVRELNGRKFKRILDVGCGAGVLTPIIRELYPDSEILGIDSSPDMIRFADKRYGGIAEFKVIDFFDYQGKHDLVIGFYSFEFFTLAQGIEKIKELLEPGGMCIIVATGRASFSIIHQFLVSKFLRTQLYLYSPSDFYSLFQDTKFSLGWRIISGLEGSYILTIKSKET